MPNWCKTNVTITASPESIDVLVKEFMDAMRSNPLEADFGNRWLGNLLLHIGMDSEAVIRGDVRCRGEVSWLEKQNDTSLHLELLSAWNPAMQCIKLFCDHFVKDAEILYVAEEPGNMLYWTNNPDVAGRVFIETGRIEKYPEAIRYLIDGCQDEPKEEVVRAFSECLGCKADLMVIEKQLNSKKYSGASTKRRNQPYAVFHVFEMVKISKEET